MRKRILLVVVIHAVGLAVGLAAVPSRAETARLDALLIADGGDVRPYPEVARLPAPRWWMNRMPLPVGTLSVANFQNANAWVRAFDFDADGWLSRAEMTQAWLVGLARWRTGADFAPDALWTASGGGAPRSLRGVEISEADEHAVRGALDALVYDADAAEAVWAGVKAMLDQVIASLQPKQEWWNRRWRDEAWRY
ncbi:MAG: hypothetical protein VW405_07190 [Rhodospirillaceae bacterium]